MFKRYEYIEGLTNLLGSNGKFLINNDGQIKDIKGNDIEIRRDDEGNKVVTCTSWDGTREYRVIDLVALQFKGLCIPQEDFDKVIAFTIDGNPENTHASNIGYRFQGGKLEFKSMPGFYYVPGMTSVAINYEGVPVNVKKLNRLKLYTTKPGKNNIKGGYRTFSAIFSPGRSISYLRHRALCLVFKEYPDNVDDVSVNHKNGIPGDDWLDNLEWATRRENNIHAYANNLKNQNDHVLVRNVLTDEVTDYYSLSECARALKLESHASVLYRIKASKFGQVFQDGTQIKLKSDPRDWIMPENPEEEIRKNLQRIPILVRDCRTLQVKEYDSVTDAAKGTGIYSGTIMYRINVGNESPLFGYQFKLAENQTPWRLFTPEEYQSSLIPNSFKVDARNLLTGEIKSYSSIREAEKALNGLSIRFAFQKNKQPMNEDGWQVKRADEEWIDVQNVEETIYKLRQEVMAKEEATGKITIASSAKQMGEILQLDPKAIRVVAYSRGNKLYHGYRFRLGVTTEPWPETNIALPAIAS